LAEKEESPAGDAMAKPDLDIAPATNDIAARLICPERP
jgi:hypothetical protein